ncbi:hypothetical protein ACIA5C_31270 [Actinoplanes sp. NPDC051343]|uniref:hypothetical protein n=1 Tax=Actinoplanes sp. NPDC051343 TaxID=3363906 RepID=UPI0037A2B179
MRIKSGFRTVITVVTSSAVVAAMALVSTGTSASASTTSLQGSASGVVSSPPVNVSDDVLAAGIKHIADANATATRTNGKAAERVVRAVHSQVDSGAVSLKAVDPSKLLWSDAEVVQAKEGGRAVRVPASEARGDESAVAFILHGDHIASVMEQKFSPVSSTALRLQFYFDGQLRLDKVADSATKVVSDYADWAPGGAATPALSWSKLNNCLASMGIPWAVITLLSVACGIACALTAGFACAACLLEAGAGTLSTIQYCLSKS